MTRRDYCQRCTELVSDDGPCCHRCGASFCETCVPDRIPEHWPIAALLRDTCALMGVPPARLEAMLSAENLRSGKMSGLDLYEDGVAEAMEALATRGDPAYAALHARWEAWLDPKQHATFLPLHECYAYIIGCDSGAYQMYECETCATPNQKRQ